MISCFRAVFRHPTFLGSFGQRALLGGAILAVAGFAAVRAGGPPVDKPTQPFRNEHKNIQVHLGHIHEWNGELAKAPPQEQREKMNKIVGFLKDHIAEHAKWEERVLYPAVDRRAGGSDPPFTASMRYEHTVVGRWIGELERIAGAEKLDAVAFARRTDNLLGLIWAHFEEEEEVLLPILDRTMTTEEFQREILDHAQH